jgi:hypothetical protein
VASLGLAVSGLGVDGIAQMSDAPSPPGWVQAVGRLEQGWLGLGRGVGEQVGGAGGQHRGMGHRALPGGDRLGGGGAGAAEQGPGGADTAVGGVGAQVERLRSQLAVEAARCWSQWPSRRSTSRRNPRVWAARAASASPARAWAASPSTASASAPRPSRLSEHLFDSMAATYQAPTEGKHQTKSVDRFLA